MITLLSRILTYLNGTLFNDDYYRFCLFVIENYTQMDSMTLDKVIGKSRVKKGDILAFCRLLGFNSYEAFNEYLMQTHSMRMDQIRARMIDVNSDTFMDMMGEVYSKEELKEKISMICKMIFEADRIVLFGAQYPMAISVEMQTDFISLGKPSIQYHSFIPMQLTEKDVAIVVSGTGRYIQDFNKEKEHVHLERAQSILITQNKAYADSAMSLAKHAIIIPGKYDGINFNYQLMMIFDLLRIHYYQQYYL